MLDKKDSRASAIFKCVLPPEEEIGASKFVKVFNNINFQKMKRSFCCESTHLTPPYQYKKCKRFREVFSYKILKIKYLKTKNAKFVNIAYNGKYKKAARKSSDCLLQLCRGDRI